MTTLSVTRLGPHQYRVGKWDVDLKGMTKCHCPDYLYRKESKGGTCKHIRCAILLEGTKTDHIEVRIP